MPHTLLIDGNSIGYASQAATKLTSGGMETQAAFGIFRTMRELRLKYPLYTPMVLWDGRAQWRYDLHPGYKGNRDNDAEKVAMKSAYAAQKPFIVAGLQHLGVRQVTDFAGEADDLGGFFVRKLSADPTHRIGLITGDQDWLQLVRQNVFWRDMRDDSKIVYASNFYEKTACRTPLEFLETKCLTGDSSDTISGVGGIGKTGAPEFIAEFGSVREFWRRCDAGEFKPKALAHKRLWKGNSEHDKDAWLALHPAGDPNDPAYNKSLRDHIMDWPGQGRALFKRNFQLMQLLKVKTPLKENLQVLTGKHDKEAFAKVCEELAFISILKNLDEFTNLFLPRKEIT